MTRAAPRFLSVGRIGRAHGIEGEVRIDVFTDFPDRFVRGAEFLLGPEQAEPGPNLNPVVLLTVRPHQEWLLGRFDVAEDRDEAALLTGRYIYVPGEDARELEEGAYYHHQLTGLEAISVEGEPLGRVSSIIETGTADVLLLHDGERTRLVPMIAEVIKEIDLDAGHMVIKPLPGLFD